MIKALVEVELIKSFLSVCPEKIISLKEFVELQI